RLLRALHRRRPHPTTSIGNPIRTGRRLDPILDLPEKAHLYSGEVAYPRAGPGRAGEVQSCPRSLQPHTVVAYGTRTEIRVPFLVGEHGTKREVCPCSPVSSARSRRRAATSKSGIASPSPSSPPNSAANTTHTRSPTPTSAGTAPATSSV